MLARILIGSITACCLCVADSDDRFARRSYDDWDTRDSRDDQPRRSVPKKGYDFNASRDKSVRTYIFLLLSVVFLVVCACLILNVAVFPEMMETFLTIEL